MHLTDIGIDEIVKVNDLPCYARGWATFTQWPALPVRRQFRARLPRRPHLRLAPHRRQGHGPHHAYCAGNPRTPRLHRHRQARARRERGLRVRARDGLPGAHASRHVLTFTPGPAQPALHQTPLNRPPLARQIQ